MTGIALFCAAAAAAIIVSSLTDWFFFGVLFHDRYQAHPEVWRQSFAGANEWKAILATTVISAMSACVFLGLLRVYGLHGYWQPLELAALVWLIAALPATATNFIFVKMHPALLVSHSLGWLARLSIFAASFSVILDR